MNPLRTPMFRPPSAPAPKDPPLPRPWRLALAAEIGHKDPGEESLKYVARVTPREFGPLHVFDAELEFRATEIAEEIDKLRAWNVPYALIESRFGSVDRSEKRLIEPGSLAFAEDEKERATLECMRKREETNARNVAKMEGPYDGTCSDGRCVVFSFEHGAPIPEFLKGRKPRYIDENLVSWYWEPAFPGWLGVERLPQNFGRKSYSGSDVPPVPYKIGTLPTPSWTEASAADHNGRIQSVPPDMSPRPAPTNAGHAAALEFIKEYARYLRPDYFGWQKSHLLECLVRGYGVRPHLAVQMIVSVLMGESRTRALSDMRNWKKSASLEDVQGTELTPGQREELAAECMRFAQAGRIVWHSMIPGPIERAADKVQGLIGPIVQFFKGRESATSEELARVTGAPVESTDLAAAARAANLEKVRVQTDGQRRYFWQRKSA
jgi:hypothetical protein